MSKNNPISHNPLMTVKQVAAYLNMNEKTIYEWALKGRIPGIKMGRTWRFRREDLEEWLEGQRRDVNKNR